MNVAGLVYKGALYLYAAEGIVPQPYNKEMLDAALRPDFETAKWDRVVDGLVVFREEHAPDFSKQ